jgi:ribose/xylose/arabinose/galactoside ABC-type transport system permease subunit
MLAILGVSIAVILVLAVSILYWFVMRRKKGEQIFSHSFV